ncbi:MAG: hypothetical protein IKE23_08910 [Exiguobacterium sp.]|nr:hypothetical protein [Exiguobacterium sp.]
MEPITRKEKYLAKLNGQDINIDPPITNEEYYLAYLCGEDYGLPTPVTLDEMYLAAMCGVIYARSVQQAIIAPICNPAVTKSWNG